MSSKEIGELDLSSGVFLENGIINKQKHYSNFFKLRTRIF